MIGNSPFYPLLKKNEGKKFRLVFSDGEVAIAKVVHVDDEHDDFIYDLISSSTTREKYKDKADQPYVGRFDDLTSAELEK
ncbi:MAG: hypothetical protein WBV46_18625 [Terriglobales bacterium]|jgi:hypothetical protein